MMSATPEQWSRRAALLGAIAICGISGCAGYRFGSATLFRPGIRTVHVPVVRNDTFRLDLGIRLSEALVKEIDRRTPYKVTGDPNADTTLNCRIFNATKRVLTENVNDDPRALETGITVNATWTSRNGELLMQDNLTPDARSTIAFGQDSRFVPEAGQTIDSATQVAIENLAERIVSQMEIRW